MIDVCSAIHFGILEQMTDPKSHWDIGAAAPILDRFVEAISEVRVIGSVELEESGKHEDQSTFGFELGMKAEGSPSLSGVASMGTRSSAANEHREKRQGVESAWINFNYLNQRTRAIGDHISQRRLWVLVDEWSTVPSDLQPYLADLLRRTFFTVPNISVKIAAIEHRSSFKMDRDDNSYIGFELGADISAAINLDDYLVFDNDKNRSEDFFRTLICNHTSYIAKEISVDLGVDPSSIVHEAFTQNNVFTQFVVASEGVPRDAMHILASAAQRANDSAISMPTLRTAALTFFQTDKYQAIQSNPENRLLLDWIRDEVIGNRRTRAFLLPMGTDDEIIDRLFDRRALHIKSRSMSSAHRPGERFVVYKLDYGFYADLMNTAKAPTGFLLEGVGDVESDEDSAVPGDDLRSYRRAVLDLEKFYEANPSVNPAFRGSVS